jgi:hypothetical protein
MAGQHDAVAGPTMPDDRGDDKPSDQVRSLQRQLRAAAKRAPARRLRASSYGPMCAAEVLRAGEGDAQLVRRACVAKADGAERPLGIPAVRAGADAAGRRTTGQRLAGYSPARLERGCRLCRGSLGLKRAGIDR